jgi:hypothetical protein
MAIVYRQDYTASWATETSKGSYRLVNWDGNWDVFLDKVYVRSCDTFNNGLAFIESCNTDSLKPEISGSSYNPEFEEAT